MIMNLDISGFDSMSALGRNLPDGRQLDLAAYAAERPITARPPSTTAAPLLSVSESVVAADSAAVDVIRLAGCSQRQMSVPWEICNNSA
jgi:hypothetical protein